MNWTSFHTRGAILRTVITVADERLDGRLPMDLDGVSDTFADELELLGALQLRWHTRLAGKIEQLLSSQPMNLEDRVVEAWLVNAQEMPGVRRILDHYIAHPASEAMEIAMTKAVAKERLLLAVMAGLGGVADELAIPVGARLEERARASCRPVMALPEERPSLFDRLRAAFAA